MSLKKWLKGNPDRLIASSFTWNAFSSMLYALQSTIILFVLQRLADEYVSGMFTITFTTANLLIPVGKYGVRNFQVSDVRRQYSFSDYCVNRAMTTTAMMVVTVVYCCFAYYRQGYSIEKTSVCFWLCMLKMVDVVEDVILGEIHRSNRLDIASRAIGLRLILTDVVLVVAFCVTRNLSISTCISVIASVFFLILITWNMKDLLDKPNFRTDFGPARKILRDCFPLFLNSFLAMFIINAPKYAIDSLMTDDVQAVYGFISLPLMVISLLSDFLCRPMIVTFTADWENRNYAAFCKRMLIIAAVIGGLTVICVVGGVIVGIPVLSWFFKFNLRPYWQPMAVLLFGGGILALSSFLAMLMTLMRQQKVMAYIYVLTAITSMPLAKYAVRYDGLNGATMAYLLTISILCACTIAVVAFYILQVRKKKRGK